MTSSSVDERFEPPYIGAGIAAAIVFLMYLITLAPTTALWDAGEYMAAAYGLGTPHPPGNPFFVLLGRVFSILPIAPTVAQRINVLAAVASAVAAGVWFVVAYRVLAEWLPARWHRLVGAAASAAVGATAFTVWNQSVVNEKVYTISLAGLALISLLVIRWLDSPDGRSADRKLLLIAYLLGLGYANHMAGMLAGPAVALAVMARRPRIVLRWRLILLALVVAALGLTPFAIQPIRAALHPAMNTGEPTGCVDGLAVGCTLSQTTYDRMKALLDRDQYGKPSVLARPVPLGDQVGMWWMYFKWQWIGGPHAPARTQQYAALVFLALGLIGGYAHWRHHRQSFWYFGPLMFTLTLGLIYYLNFKLGHSQAVAMGIPFDDELRVEVRDRDYFYLWSFSAWGVWVALGLSWLWARVVPMTSAAGRGGRAAAWGTSPRWAMALPIFLIALIPLGANWRAASRAGDTFPRDWAIDILNSVEPYGVLITNGDNDTFPLWYAQNVEGIRRDVTVAVTSYLRTDWYPRQIIRRPIYEYDSSRGPALYRTTDWARPSEPALRMSLQESDSVGEIVILPSREVTFRKDDITATITGSTHPMVGGPFISRDQFMVLRFIADSFPERPIYFTSPGFPADLGLGRYLLRQGLVTRLSPHPADQMPGAIEIPGAGWIDAPRTIALWNDVYRGSASLLARRRWMDDASRSIPNYYAATGAVTAEVLAMRGERTEADTVIATVRQIIQVMGLD